MALSPRFRATAVVAAAALGGLLPPSAALAGQPYEQISRTSGAYLSAQVAPFAQEAALGDVGRFAAFRGSFPNGQSGAFVRDVRNNLTTQPGGAATKQIWGFDRAETKALIAREINGKVELRIAPLVGGGTSKLIYSATGTYYYGLQAQLSGDGSTVVVTDRFTQRILKINVATTQVTVLQTRADTNNDAWEFGPQAISDDGRTVVVSRPYIDDAGNYGGRIYRDGQPTVELGRPGIVSPNGSTVASVNQSIWPYVVTVRKLATGAIKTFNAPDVASGGPWINSDGSKLVFYGYGTPGYVEFNTATGASAVAGPSGQFGGMRSPSGRFALLGPILYDTTGADLPGGEDPISADYYLKPGATYNCRLPVVQKNYGTVNMTLRTQPISWAPKAVKADVQLYVDVSLLKTTTVLPGQSTSAPFNGNPKFYRVVATVTDELGRLTKGEVKYPFSTCA